MATEHAIITMKDGDIVLKPGSPGAKTKVNGLALTDELKLKHHDRIVFGTFVCFIDDISNFSFVYVIPKNPFKIFTID